MKHKIYNLLMIEHRAILDACYRQVFFQDSQTPAIKTFEDCLSDFYLYLLEAKPKRVPGEVEGYYLTQVKDEKALPEWLRQTFRRFLLEEHKILSEMQEALSEYRNQMAAQHRDQPLDITLMHVAFSLAWFNQHETEQDRYLFFRSAYKHFSGFYSWPDDDLDDNDVAMVLEITPGTLRTRTSRLCAKVRRLVTEINDAMISSFNRQSLDIAHGIFAEPDPDIESILEELLDKAERDLPQYEKIVSMRRDKRRSMRALEKLSDSMVMDDVCCCPSGVPEKFVYEDAAPAESSASRIVSMFKSFVGIC